MKNINKTKTNEMKSELMVNRRCGNLRPRSPHAESAQARQLALTAAVEGQLGLGRGPKRGSVRPLWRDLLHAVRRARARGVGLWKDSLGSTASLRSGRPTGGTIQDADIIHDLVRFCTCCVVCVV